MPLTRKAEGFLSLLAQGMPEWQAARATWTGGYATQKRYLKNTDVVAGMKAIQLAVQEETKISRLEVEEGIREAINQAVLLEDPATQIKGFVELAKMHGYYEPEKTITEHHVIAYQEMSTQQLLERARNSQAITLATSDFEKVETEVPVG